MKQLLEQWAELEPERCRGNSVIIDGHFVNVGYSITPLALLQYATQQAIEARGWKYTIECREKDYRAIIGSSWLPMGDEILGDERKDTPAEALLSAYLNALKAVEVEG